jgi:tetratricopeptide (TPR) repeat protein
MHRPRFPIDLRLLRLVFAASLGLLAPAAGFAADPVAALSEGNGLVQEGKLEEAVAAYLAGYDPQAVHPTLAYNLGATYQRMGALPEAILWYRRAERADDPWLEDNLLLARRSLGSQTVGNRGPWGQLGQWGAALQGVAIALSWLAALAAWRRWPRALTVACLAGALGALGLVQLAVSRQPRAGVLLKDCAPGNGTLTAGTELWVTPAAAGWRIAGSNDAVCPPETIELVDPLP